MVKIDIFDYLNSNVNKKFESKNFGEIEKELEELHEYNIIFEELENSRFFDESSMHVNNDVFIQFKSLICEINNKKEIVEKLNSLAHHISTLKSVILTKNKDKSQNYLVRIIKNNNDCINSIVEGLNSFKNKIDQLESLHMDLMKSGFSIDIKALLEQEFGKKHKELNSLYNKQKNILLNLSTIFLALAKDSMVKKG